MKQKGCAASRAEQKPRIPENLDARVCEAHFCSTMIESSQSMPYTVYSNRKPSGCVFCLLLIIENDRVCFLLSTVCETGACGYEMWYNGKIRLLSAILPPV